MQKWVITPNNLVFYHKPCESGKGKYSLTTGYNTPPRGYKADSRLQYFYRAAILYRSFHDLLMLEIFWIMLQTEHMDQQTGNSISERCAHDIFEFCVPTQRRSIRKDFKGNTGRIFGSGQRNGMTQDLLLCRVNIDNSKFIPEGLRASICPTHSHLYKP